MDVTCPNCSKSLKVPPELEGKRVKCKGCQQVFTIKAPADEPKPEEKPKSPFLDDDDEPGGVPRSMGVIAEEDVPRCPHCAVELDPPDAVICTECGFNNRTRTRAETKKVYAPDAMDWMSHLGPGIIALLIVIALVVVDIVCGVKMRGWMEGGMLESEEKGLDGRSKFYVAPGAFIALICFISLIIIIPAAKFAIKRLIIDNKPPEKVKK
jgi:hypothetical protein